MNKQKIENIFKQLEVPSWNDGVNVTEGWVNIRCPFCTDRSNHCGVDPSTGMYSCWRCTAAGPLERLLQRLTGYSSDECKRLIEEPYHSFKKNSVDQINDMINLEKEITKKQTNVTEMSWPEYSQPITHDTDSKLLEFYLSKRGIKIDTLIKHKCHICEVGHYMHRIIIPVFYKDVLVSYQAADMTGRACVKYETAPGDINNYLYNYDNINRKKMILVEAALDSWRIGEDVCATFGTSISKAQERLILDKKLDVLIFCWDSDAYWLARKASKYFEPFIEKVSIIKFPGDEDPDSYGKKFGEETLYNLIWK